jgi:glycosyltransferase involved in cell wall biosynthesis
MEIRTAHILIASLRSGDATGQHTMDLVRVLQSHGVAVQVYVEQRSDSVPAEFQPLVVQTSFADYSPTADLTILQYPIWFPLAERLRNAPGAAIFWYHGVTPPALWGANSGLSLLQTSEIRTSLAWHAHLAVAASPFTAQELHRHAGYPLERIRVVSLGVDVDAFSAAPDWAVLATLHERWRLAGKRVMLYVGRIAGNKRIDLVIQALASLRPTHPDLCLLIVGNISQGDATRELAARLQRLAVELGVADAVIWTDRVPDVKPFLHLAHVGLLASQHEGFGVPLVEAMAAGLPVVASAGGALPWVIGAGSDGSRVEEAAGLLFAPGDAADLARQVTRLLDDPALRAELVDRGCKRARQFGLEPFAEQVWEVVCAAAELHAAGPAPAQGQDRHPLFAYADIAMRGYTVRSGAPVAGRWIEWIRRNSTTHVKEAYLDPMIERQVTFNQQLALEVERLQAEVVHLREQLAALHAKQARRDDSTERQ